MRYGVGLVPYRHLAMASCGTRSSSLMSWFSASVQTNGLVGLSFVTDHGRIPVHTRDAPPRDSVTVGAYSLYLSAQEVAAPSTRPRLALDHRHGRTVTMPATSLGTVVRRRDLSIYQKH
jgi:hypothetical protein